MSVRKPVYLDYNAGAPLHPRVAEALLRFLGEPAALSSSSVPVIPNPSSVHTYGRQAKQMLAEARERVARSLGAVSTNQLIFTSSGTEANQLAIRSVLEPALDLRKAHWITTPVEHHSVRVMEEWVRQKGGVVSHLPVDHRGVIRVDEARRLVDSGADLLSMVWVGNETGVIQPIADVIELARAFGIPVHLDASQAWGKVPFDLATLGVDWAAFSAHKIGAPAGTGVLYSRVPGSIQPLLRGSQEAGRRGGTENLLGTYLTGIAAEHLDPSGFAEVALLRDRLESLVLDRIPEAFMNGAGAPRVGNTSNMSFRFVESAALVMALDLAGYCVSAGSACASGALKPSHVLLAMGLSPSEAMASIRVSIGRSTSWEELEAFADALTVAVNRASKRSLKGVLA